MSDLASLTETISLLENLENPLTTQGVFSFKGVRMGSFAGAAIACDGSSAAYCLIQRDAAGWYLRRIPARLPRWKHRAGIVHHLPAVLQANPLVPQAFEFGGMPATSDCWATMGSSWCTKVWWTYALTLRLLIQGGTAGRLRDGQNPYVGQGDQVS